MALLESTALELPVFFFFFYQFIGLLAVASWSFVVTGIIVFLIDKIFGVVNEEPKDEPIKHSNAIGNILGTGQARIFVRASNRINEMMLERKRKKGAPEISDLDQI